MEFERVAREKKYDDEQLLELRRKQVKPVIEEFYEFIGSLNPGKGSHLYEAVNYAQNQKKELMVFLDYPIAEMTNNLAERTVKPFVIDRKNFLFSDTEKGANTKHSLNYGNLSPQNRIYQSFCGDFFSIILMVFIIIQIKKIKSKSKGNE